MTHSPSLAELRLRSQKQQHRVIGNWLARHVARPSAIYGTWLAVRLNLTANQITGAALLAAIGGAVALGVGTPSSFVLAVTLWHLAYWLDHVDGQVARWSGSASLDGVYLDYLLHHVWSLSQGFALGYGLAHQTGELAWTVAGFAIALGWGLLSLHNDCRYKAIFQRLKSERRSFRIDGGSGDRPAPAPPWPKRGLGMVTWPAAKLCEPHVVLLTLTILTPLAILLPTVWFITWQTYVIVMAVGSPTLALGRIVQSVRQQKVEGEFHRWFHPIISSPMD